MLGHNLDVDASRLTHGLFDDACRVRTHAQNITALSPKNRFRTLVIHGRASPIDANQPPSSVKDKNAVRHRVKGRFPLLLGALNHFEQLRLPDTGRQLCGHGFDQQDFIFSPVSGRLDLIDGDHAAKFPVNRERIIDLRYQSSTRGMSANAFGKLPCTFRVLLGIINHQRRMGFQEMTAQQIIVAGVEVPKPFASGRQISSCGRRLACPGIVKPHTHTRGIKCLSQFSNCRIEHFGETKRSADSHSEFID